MVITNNHVFRDLDLGPVPKGKKNRSESTTHRYIDGDGLVRFCGNSSLKTSQIPVLDWENLKHGHGNLACMKGKFIKLHIHKMILISTVVVYWDVFSE